VDDSGQGDDDPGRAMLECDEERTGFWALVFESVDEDEGGRPIVR